MKKLEIRGPLFVPAQKDKLRKIKDLSADAYIIDLEDSIKPENKEDALNEVKIFFEHFTGKEQPIFVRVNNENLDHELEVLSQYPIDGYVLPKFEEVCVLEQIKEVTGNRKLIPLIETPKGVVNLKLIASHSETWAIAFGAEDYCCCTGMKNEDVYLLPIKVEMVNCARAYEKRCYDTVFHEYKDQERMQQQVIESKNMGFDGKLAIHPKQVDVIRTIYSPQTREEIVEILDAFGQCDAGVLVFKGKIYEKPHIERMKRELAKYRNV